jgi:hypothetical protein
MFTSHLFNDVLSCSLVVLMKAARRHDIRYSFPSATNKGMTVGVFGNVWNTVAGNTEHLVIMETQNFTPNVFFHLIFRWEQ